MNLVSRAEEIAAVHPEGYRMTLQVVAAGSDYWPLPWYLRRFENAAFRDAVPEQMDADMVIASPALEPQIRARLRGDYYQEFFGLRTGVLLKVFTRQTLWDAFMRKQSQEGS
jgi:predicted membrane-bound mannosyltransferase